MRTVNFNRFSLPLAHVFVFVIFIGMGYLVRHISLTKVAEINHAHALLGGMGIWVAYLAVMLLSQEHSRQYNWFTFTLSIIGGFSTCALFLTGMLLLMPLPQIAETSDIAKNIAIQARCAVVFKIHVILFLYSLFCFVAFWTRYQVANGTMVLFNNRILYPGQGYIIIPVFWYNTCVVKENIEMSIEKVEFRCQDVNFLTTVKTTIRLDIDSAERQGCTEFDRKNFLEMSREEIIRIIKGWAINTTYGKLLTNKPELSVMSINGFPVIWDGKVEYLESKVG